MTTKSNVSSSSSGVSSGSLLTIVFIVLKLTGVINWSWWWVLAPTWIPLAILGVILALVGVVILGVKLSSKI